jgi:hypothetical protein
MTKQADNEKIFIITGHFKKYQRWAENQGKRRPESSAVLFFGNGVTFFP